MTAFPVFILAAGQNPFTTAERQTDYTYAFPLGAREPTALEVSADFWQLANSYTRPAAGSNVSVVSPQNVANTVTAYFVDDLNFEDIGAGVKKFTRTWATVPATWYEDSQYAFAYPAYGGVAIGNIANVTAISANRAVFPWQYTLAAGATGLAAADTAFVDINYNQGTYSNIHASTPAQVISANATHVIISSSFYDNGAAFTGVTGTIRKMTAYRATPGDSEPVDAIITHDYALTDGTVANIANVLPTVPKFVAVAAASGEKTDTLTSATVPTAATYASMVAAGTLLVAEPSVRNPYAGLIHERRTIQVRAG